MPAPGSSPVKGAEKGANSEVAIATVEAMWSRVARIVMSPRLRAVAVSLPLSISPGTMLLSLMTILVAPAVVDTAESPDEVGGALARPTCGACSVQARELKRTEVQRIQTEVRESVGEVPLPLTKKCSSETRGRHYEVSAARIR